MNNNRRKSLSKLCDEIDALKTTLEEILGEEQEAFDNIPENLEGTERYEKAEEAIDSLDSAISALEEALEYIESAQE